MGLIMNLIRRTYHLYEKREYTFMIHQGYIIIFPVATFLKQNEEVIQQYIIYQKKNEKEIFDIFVIYFLYNFISLLF